MGAPRCDDEEDAMDLGLAGKHAIVTGGSLGIGKAIARELAREGADVVIAARSKAPLEAAAAELAAETRRRVIAIPADVTSREQVETMVEQAAAQLGGLHILVNSGSPPGARPRPRVRSRAWWTKICCTTSTSSTSARCAARGR